MTGDPGAYSGTDGDPGAYARPDTDSPLAGKLDELECDQMNLDGLHEEAACAPDDEQAGLNRAIAAAREKRNAARAAILAEFAMLEVERDFYLREAKFFSDQRDALRAALTQGREG